MGQRCIWLSHQETQNKEHTSRRGTAASVPDKNYFFVVVCSLNPNSQQAWFCTLWRNLEEELEQEETEQASGLHSRSLRNTENLERDTGSFPSKTSWSNGVTFWWASKNILFKLAHRNQLCLDLGEKFISVPNSKSSQVWLSTVGELCVCICLLGFPEMGACWWYSIA